MGKGLVKKTFEMDDTWTAPAGVTRVRASAILKDVSASASCAEQGSFGIDIYGQAFAFGLDGSSHGYLGLNNAVASLPFPTPTIVVGGHKWRQARFPGAQSEKSILLDQQGNAFGCGINSAGGLGDGTILSRSSPVLVVGGRKFVMVDSGSQCGAGLTCERDIVMWGNNAAGQLGDGTIVAKSSPVLVVGGQKWKHVALGASTSFGIDENDDLYSWGSHASGLSGQGLSTGAVSSPVLVLGGLKWKTVSASTHAVGITLDGDAYAWGLNQFGKLGLGDLINRSSPVLIPGGIKWKRGFAEASQTALISEDDDGYSCGQNLAGGLGHGDVISKSSPVLVIGGKKWKYLQVGFHSIGTTTDGDLYGFGTNANGNLGQGSSGGAFSSPIIVSGARAWKTFDVPQPVDIDVTPGQSYDVTVQARIAKFGDVPLGSYFVEKIVLEYVA